MGKVVTINAGFAVGLRGTAVKVFGLTGVAVTGVAVMTGTSTIVLSLDVGGAVRGITGAIDGAAVSMGDSVGGRSIGASKQISPPPITSRGAISEH